VLLIWMWITNAALLLGAELNAQRERRGQPPQQRDPESDGEMVPPQSRSEPQAPTGATRSP
jgi:uncharacterized BrkB/YihY/UPF0761 family membrane protein